MRKKDRIAVRRRFRDAIVFWRSFSKPSRKARTRSASSEAMGNATGSTPVSPMHELQQQAKGIAITRDRLGAETFLRHEVVREEDLQERPREYRRRHWTTPSWPGASTSCRGGLQEFRRAGDIPIGVGRAQMPEVDRQVRQPLLDIASLAMPTREAVHREGVSEGMERRCALPGGCLDAGMVEQSLKGEPVLV